MSDSLIKILIAEDTEPLRRLYKKIINAAPDMEVVADTDTGRDAVTLSLQTQPDVILMDIEMETPDAGLRAVESILGANQNPKIIILTVYEEDELIFTAFRLGVIDYLIKNAPPTRFWRVSAMPILTRVRYVRNWPPKSLANSNGSRPTRRVFSLP